MLKELLLLGVGLAGCSGCLGRDVDPQGQTPVTLSAVQWEAWDADTDELIETGCAEGRPTIHATAGQKVRLKLMYETVKRKPGLTNDACSTEDDLSRAPQADVLAARCYLDFVAAGPAELISFTTIPADAKDDGVFAKASGYVYVLEALRSGTVKHTYATDCGQIDPAASVADLVVKK